MSDVLTGYYLKLKLLGINERLVRIRQNNLGYVLYYVDSAYYNALSDENKEEYFEQPVIKEQVDFDNQFVLEEVFKEVEDNSIIKTEDMDSISDGFMDITLKINGVEDGKISYSRVVGLLLKYYDGVLYSE